MGTSPMCGNSRFIHALQATYLFIGSMDFKSKTFLEKRKLCAQRWKRNRVKIYSHSFRLTNVVFFFDKSKENESGLRNGLP